MPSKRIAILAVIASCSLFATGAASRAFAGFIGTPISVAAWRVFIGSVGLLFLSRHRGGLGEVRQLFARPVTWLMGVAVLGYQLAFFVATLHVGVAIGTMIALGLAPFVAGILAWTLGSRRPAAVWWGATALAVGGLSLLTGVSGQLDTLGLLAAVLASAMYAMYTVLGGRLVHAHGMHGTEVLAAGFAVAGLYSLPLLFTGGTWYLSGKGIALALWVGLASTTVAYALFGIGITALPSGTVATLTLAEPVFAATYAVTLLGESLTARGWVGCGIIIAALGILGWSESSAKTVDDEVLSVVP